MSAPRPNIIFIMSDDHAAHAIGAYGSRINATPHIDRLAAGGMRLDNCFCTNAICAPSRASILTGTHTHINGVTTLGARLDGRQETFPKLLQAAGYQTGIVGKWHLGHGGVHDPTGFDYWNVLPGQGLYRDPEFIAGGEESDGGAYKTHQGYVTDIITDLALDWLGRRDRERPFCLLVHHKAPHRPWEPDARYADLYEEIDIPEPSTFDDDYRNRAQAAAAARMRVDRDLTATDLKQPVPEGLTAEAEKRWKYQRYIKDYLRCVAAIDDNVGRLLDYLDEAELADDTIISYTSDQGFFLGDHGWYDKRFMYEESLRMPFLIRYPRAIAPGTTNADIVTNLDFAPTFLDYAGLPIPATFQGASLRPLLGGATPADWQTALYYRYWMHLGDHYVYAHYGIRTRRHKLIYYYADALGQPATIDEPKEPEWELFDLERDPHELHSVFHDPAYATIVGELRAELRRLQEQAGDQPHSSEGRGSEPG